MQGKGRLGLGNKPQHSRVPTQDPLTQLLGPLRFDGFRGPGISDLGLLI